MTVVNISNFAFHLVISRILGPAVYGGLGALLGVLLVLQVPVAAVEVAITQRVASRGPKPDGDLGPLVIGPLVSRAVIGAIVLVVLVGVLSPAISGFLHLASATAVTLLGLMVVPVLIELVPKALLLGQRRFRPVAFALVGGAGARLVLGVLLTRAGAGISGAIGATVFGELVVATSLLLAVRDAVAHGDEANVLRIRLRDAGRAALALTGFWTFLGIDTLMARHYLPRSQSGYYAAAATAARAVLFLPAAVALVAFPRFAEDNGRSPGARRALIEAVLVVGGMGAAAALVILAFPRLFISTIFGGQYVGSAGIVGMLALSAAAMGLVSVLLHYLLATRSRAAMLIWVAVVGVVCAIVAFHHSIRQVASNMLIAALLLTLTIGVVALRKGRVRTTERWMGERHLWDLVAPEVELTLVVPHFNPGPRFRPNIDRLIAVLEAQEKSFEIIAVSDGSTDGSETALGDIAGETVRCVAQARNTGKGSALRLGLAMARGRYIGFIDADGDVVPDLLTPFLKIIDLYEPDIVLGSKRHPLSEVDYPLVRRMYSWGYQQLIRTLFRLNIRDTQTGLKIIRRDVLARTLPVMVEKRFAFDLELFVVARHLGYRRFFEAPVRLEERFSTTISPRAVWRMFVDTMAIFYRLRILRFYDRQVSDSVVSTSTGLNASSAP
jgi:O-antigen/teichoic acid export membrane protein